MSLFPSRFHSSSGLSLVEVALALGIMSFVLVAVFSLTASSLRQLQFSEADSKVALVAQQAIALARFELGRDADFRNPSGAWQGGSRELYFDKEGQLMASNTVEAYFLATLNLTALPTGTTNALANVPADSLKSMSIGIVWPAAAGSNATVNSRHFSLLFRNSGRL
jgi:uncharacterized protein (TIGR02598 family)